MPALAERDCGVYAVNVAYEAFLTARGGGPALDFSLVSVPGHVMLAIQLYAAGRRLRGQQRSDRRTPEGDRRGSRRPVHRADLQAAVHRHPGHVGATRQHGHDKSGVQDRRVGAIHGQLGVGLNIAQGLPGEYEGRAARADSSRVRGLLRGSGEIRSALRGALETGLNGASGLPSEQQLAEALDKLPPDLPQGPVAVAAAAKHAVGRRGGTAPGRPGAPGAALEDPHRSTFGPPAASAREGGDGAAPAPVARWLADRRRPCAGRVHVGVSPFDVQVSGFVKAGMPSKF